MRTMIVALAAVTMLMLALPATGSANGTLSRADAVDIADGKLYNWAKSYKSVLGADWWMEEVRSCKRVSKRRFDCRGTVEFQTKV